MKKTKLLCTLLLSFCLCQQTMAQVTIGSTAIPISGALLQLQDGTTASDPLVNASKGFGLPRVKLTDTNKLHPMLPTGYNPAEDTKHAGLVVYNTNKCVLNGKGLYVWDGGEWSRLPNEGIIGSIMFNQETFDLPSGKDARASATQPLTVGWNLAGNLTYTKTNTLGGGVPFSGANALPASPWASNPTSIGLSPDAMSATDVTAINPWKSKETKLNFVDTDCGNTIKSLTLNQTNYAMIAGTAATPIDKIRLTDQSPKTISILSNAAWQVTITSGDASIFANYTANDGAVKKDGTYINGVGSEFTYTSAVGSTGTKYKTAEITLSDINSRAKDIKITAMQCQGTDAALASLPVATPAQTSGANTWGTAVIRHQAKAGIYEEFVSASFGTAGRWMTTNLAAWSFDTNIPTTTATLPVTPGGANSNSNPQWCYPSVTSSITNTEYAANTQLGLLYNFPAATAKLSSMLNESATQYTNRQGICPNGWHLPSDYEWIQLEQEIIQRTTTYANVSQIIDAGGTDASLPANQRITLTNPNVNWLGSTHGQAMKEICDVGSVDPVGTSKPAVQGGFAALLAGSVYNTASNRFGYSAYFWSSSNYDGGHGWARSFDFSLSQVYRNYYPKSTSVSVRCKKD